MARVPTSVTGDALALSLLARGIDLVTRITHPALRRLLGTGELDGDLVLVEAWREGATLREVLDAGGPLTPELAARVAVEVAGALHACRTLPPDRGRPLCHGALRAERILLAEDGAVLLCGMGRAATEELTAEGDLRDLARALLECLPPAHGEAPGALQAVLDRALVADGFPTAEAFAEAISGAVTPAGPSAVAARAERSQTEGTPAWLSRRRALAQALRGEDGATADEIGAVPAPVAPVPPAPPARPPPAEVAANGAPTLPQQAATPPAPPPRAVTPPPPAPASARPAQMPPPLPAVRVSLASHGGDQFIEHEPTGGAVAGPPPIPPAPPSPGDPWLEHPRAPALVTAVSGLIGLLLGLALGGR